jgi:LPXTG-motif cell wall-anchored protein
MADQSSPEVPNPRGKKSGDRRLTPRTGSTSTMWYVLTAVLLLALGQAFFFSIQSGQTISYSEFKTAVREGQVQEVVVAEDRIRGTLKQAPAGKSKTFAVVRIVDS